MYVCNCVVHVLLMCVYVLRVFFVGCMCVFGACAARRMYCWRLCMFVCMCCFVVYVLLMCMSVLCVCAFLLYACDWCMCCSVNALLVSMHVGVFVMLLCMCGLVCIHVWDVCICDVCIVVWMCICLVYVWLVCVYCWRV